MLKNISSLAAAIGLGTVLFFTFSATTLSQTFTTLTSFDQVDGGSPQTGWLVQGTDGNFYGTTDEGGISSNCPTQGGGFGCGTAFKMTPGGKLTTLYNFCSLSHCSDGSIPNGLMLAANGNLYGTTQMGGTNNHGILFELTPEGTYTVIYTFCSLTDCADGFTPLGTLVQGVNGDFYGVTEWGGGARGCGVKGCGTVFEVTSEGKLTTLHVFCSGKNCNEGGVPMAGLVLASNGNFYGTNYWHGKYDEGALYEIAPTGTTRGIYSFCPAVPCTNGLNPNTTMIQATDGNLYGTTPFGGPTGGGTIYRLTLAGELTTFYDVGQTPLSRVIQGSDGNFYGTTWTGGAAEDGSVFELTPALAFTTLYGFCAKPECIDGALPNPGLTQATDGSFYGMTTGAGPYPSLCDGGCGTVYNISMGLGPFVLANPNFGGMGHVVNILGNNLTGATSVTFNGETAVFTVVADTYIKATVPPGAATGTIEVVTPSGTLNSNVAFQVLP